MNFLLIALISLFSQSPKWETDLNIACDKAIAENKMILLNFSGSDWCVPCIRLKKEIFSTQEFENFAKDQLILVNADFPSKKKNQLPDALKKSNEDLAEKYNKNGAFPLTLLLDAKGDVITKWDGLPGGNAHDFIEMINKKLNAGH